MRWEPRTFARLTAFALLIVTLVMLDFALTGGDVLAYGRHGSS